MRHSLSLALPFLLTIFGTGARLTAQSANVPEDEKKGYATLSQELLRHDVAFLASDHLQGRMSMQPGDDLAVQWISGQFAKAGLDPMGLRPSGLPGYEQTFKIIEYRADRANTAITLTRKGQPTVWHAPEAFGAYKKPVDVTAPVVFAGFGITAPDLKYDDYAGIDVTGKIVLIFDHEPQEDNPQSDFYGTGNTKYATARVKILNAQHHGAVAVILVAEPNRKHPTNGERAARIGGSITRAVPLPLQAIAEDEVTIPAVTINDDVEQTLFATSGTTGSELQTKIEAGSKTQSMTPQSMALPDTTLTLHLVNVSANEGMISNVVGLLKGSDPALKAETIILSAHHDHDGQAACGAGKEGTDQAGQPVPASADCMSIWHGADDNASGTAGVIALARAFEANGARPKRSILFVVFAGEERGLLGSYWMAAHPLRPLATTRAMINFDMIGRDETASPQTDGLMEIPADTTNRLNLVGAEYSPDYALIVADEDHNVGLTIDDRFDHEHILNVLFRSDQFPFLLKNVPAMWWFTGFHPDYHHITDTAEKIDYAKMTKILQLAYLTAWRFGSDAGVPKFIADPGPPQAPPPPVAEMPATPGASAVGDTPGTASVPATGSAAAGSAAASAPAAAAEPVKPRHHRPVTTVNLGNAAVKEGEERPTEVVLPPPVANVSLSSGSTTPAADTTGHAPVAPVSVPTGAQSAPADAGSAPTTRRAVAPVQIRATTGEAGVPATASPDAPPPTAGSSPVSPVQLAPGAAGQPPATKPGVTKVKLGGKQPGQDAYEDPPE